MAQGETVTITRVSGQPADYNNITPIYDSDDRIIFTSDRPRDGQAHLYPQLDEYEEAATVSGLWQLDPASGALRLLNHAPSGDFTPFVDSFGRVVFTQWDHLQRDQQADAGQLQRAARPALRLLHLQLVGRGAGRRAAGDARRGLPGAAGRRTT